MTRMYTHACTHARTHTDTHTHDTHVPDDSSTVLVTDVRDDVEVGSPEFELSLPVDDCRQRCAHEERTFAVALSDTHTHTAAWRNG